MKQTDKIIAEYDTVLDSKNRMTIRKNKNLESKITQYHVKIFKDGCIILDPKISTDEISSKDPSFVGIQPFNTSLKKDKK